MNREIKAIFTAETAKWDGKKYFEYNYRTYEKEIEMVIEDRGGKPILKFIGGPTGYESYYVEDMVKPRQKLSRELCICGGTVNSYHKCIVPWNEVVQFLLDSGYNL